MHGGLVSTKLKDSLLCRCRRRKRDYCSHSKMENVNSTHVKELYDKNFSGCSYQTEYYGKLFKRQECLLRNIYNLLSSGKVKGKTFLDFGCGPSVHALAAASKFFDTIVACDYTKDNRDQLKLWIENKAGAHDWSLHLKFCAKLEGFDNLEEGFIEIAARTRSKIQDVLRCDVNEKHPLEKRMDPFDVVFTSCCIESATVTADDYKAAIKNLGSLVKPKGTVVAFGIIGCTWYVVGGHKFPCNDLNKELITSAFSSAGFTLEAYEEGTDEAWTISSCDSDRFYISVFKKM